MKKLTAAQKKDIGDYFILGCFGVFIFGMIGMRIYNNAQLVPHKNVIIENNKDKMLVCDVNTNEERIIEINNPDYANYLYPGDTIVIREDQKFYDRKKVFSDKFGQIEFNNDSIYARQQREKFNVAKQSMLAKQR